MKGSWILRDLRLPGGGGGWGVDWAAQKVERPGWKKHQKGLSPSI